MLKKLSALEQEITSLRSKLDETDELHKIDLEVALDALREDLTKTHEDRLNVVKLECKYWFKYIRYLWSLHSVLLLILQALLYTDDILSFLKVRS